MGTDQRRLDLESLVKKLRYITAAVQVIPFIYSFIYIACMVLYLFCSDNIASFCDTMFYVSPISVVPMLIFSRLLRMCIWHRAACVLPIAPQALSIIDRYIVEFPWSAGVITIAISILLLSALLLCAYKVFIK